MWPQASVKQFQILDSTVDHCGEDSSGQPDTAIVGVVGSFGGVEPVTEHEIQCFKWTFVKLQLAPKGRFSRENATVVDLDRSLDGKYLHKIVF